MWIDLSPLKKNQNFRYLYLGQLISFFGTMITLVALPYQVYALTGSTLKVGLLGIVELGPLLLCAFVGGTLADTVDRKKLLIYAEIAMSIGCLLLICNALLDRPSLIIIFIIAGILSGLNGLHRPSLDAITPQLVTKDQIQAASILANAKHMLGMIGAPAFAGICIAQLGLAWTYSIDFLTFALSIVFLFRVKYQAIIPAENKINFKAVHEALHYAVKKPVLLGTYLVDFVAMVSAMPNALFPAIALSYGGTKALGWLYSAPAIGALLITLMSGWAKHVHRHGAAVGLAAMMWGTSIAMIGFMGNLLGIIVCLIFAGLADSISGMFRMTIWNETIPSGIRGRMASLEVISYSSGPLIGNAQAGFLASFAGVQMAVMLGGMFCVIGVIMCLALLPGFWQYRKQDSV